VIWVAVVVAFLAWLDQPQNEGPIIALFVASVGALLVWQLEKRRTGRRDSVEPPHAGVTLSAVYCTECGAVMDLTWKVCPHCGTKPAFSER